jgi:hypothetical protein
LSAKAAAHCRVIGVYFPYYLYVDVVHDVKEELEEVHGFTVKLDEYSKTLTMTWRDV